LIELRDFNSSRLEELITLEPFLILRRISEHVQINTLLNKID